MGNFKKDVSCFCEKSNCYVFSNLYFPHRKRMCGKISSSIFIKTRYICFKFFTRPRCAFLKYGLVKLFFQNTIRVLQEVAGPGNFSVPRRKILVWNDDVVVFIHSLLSASKTTKIPATNVAVLKPPSWDSVKKPFRNDFFGVPTWKNSKTSEFNLFLSVA